MSFHALNLIYAEIFFWLKVIAKMFLCIYVCIYVFIVWTIVNPLRLCDFLTV